MINDNVKQEVLANTLPCERINKSQENTHTIIGRKYALFNTISKNEAIELRQQEGIEIPFASMEEKIKFLLGKGCGGSLRLSRNIENKQFLAVKKIKGEAIASSQKEAFLQSQLTGKSNIMPLIDFVKMVDSRNQQSLYLFMPLAAFGNGKDLQQRLTVLKNLPLKQRILTHLARSLLIGLQSMHEMYIYHLDIKPSNIVINRQGDVYWIDFGCAVKALATQGIINKGYGNSRYYSPERLLNSRQEQDNKAQQDVIHKVLTPFDAAKADAWALGVTLLEIALNAYPFDEVSFMYRLASWDSHYFSCKLGKIQQLYEPPQGSYMAVVKGLLDPDPETHLSIRQALAGLSLTRENSFSSNSECKKVFNYLHMIKNNQSHNEIRKAARILAQGYRDKHCLFSILPKAINYKISGLTGNAQVHSEEQSIEIAKQYFCKPHI